MLIVAPASARAQTLDAGEKLHDGWLWASSVRSAPGHPGAEVFIAASRKTLEDRQKALAELASLGVPSLQILEIGTVSGEPAALVSGSSGAVPAQSDLRVGSLDATSAADIQRIRGALGKLPVTALGFAVEADGHVVVSDARPGAPSKAATKKLESELDALKNDVDVATIYRETLAAGETDHASALESARFQVKERAELKTHGVAGMLGEKDAALWKNSHLGSIDPAKLPLAGDVYRRGSYGSANEVAVRTLPSMTTSPGKTAEPLLYQTSMAIDSDGAGDAHKADKDGQDATSLNYANGDSLDPTKIPYVVLPLGFAKKHPGVQLGDVVAVFYQGKVSYGIWGDEGPVGQIGEGSIALARSLGIDADPNTGGVETGVTYIVFPRSGNGAPLTPAEIQQRGTALLKAAGGAP